MAAKPPVETDRPALWARALLGGSVAFAAISVVLLAWVS